ncbi:MAG: hypothetical protein R3E79_18165 [Caldilineaceae bacterium]
MPTFVLFPGEERPAENRLFVVDPTGQIVLDHAKYGGNFWKAPCSVDGVLQTVETPFGLLSGVICWDADFVVNMRQAGRQGVDLMVIGANDWPGINAVHAQMAVFRAIGKRHGHLPPSIQRHIHRRRSLWPCVDGARPFYDK